MKLGVNCAHDYADYPVCAIVELNEDTANKIRLFSKFVKKNDLYKIEKFDYSPLWLDHDVLEDETLTDEDRTGLVSVEAVCLNVTDDSFWWSAYLKNSNVYIFTDKLAISKLPQYIVELTMT